jgi:Holliday junction resolvase YEN1
LTNPLARAFSNVNSNQSLELLLLDNDKHSPSMGVPGLWKELQSHGQDTALARLSELRSSSSSSSQHTLRIGIDISSWLFHAQKSIGGYNPQLRLLFYRLCRLLAVPDVHPVFVFDGPQRPKEKRGKVVQKYRENSFVKDLKDLITAFGFVVHDALGEAEAEMAKMVQRGILDAVMSDDVDCFVFGATLVIRK